MRAESKTDTLHDLFPGAINREDEQSRLLGWLRIYLLWLLVGTVVVLILLPTMARRGRVLLHAQIAAICLLCSSLFALYLIHRKNLRFAAWLHLVVFYAVSVYLMLVYDGVQTVTVPLLFINIGVAGLFLSQNTTHVVTVMGWIGLSTAYAAELLQLVEPSSGVHSTFDQWLMPCLALGLVDLLIYLFADNSKRIQMEIRDTAIQLAKVNRKLADSQDTLERSARMKDEFLAMMNHELRTPLNAILANSESLSSGVYGELTKIQDRSLGRITRSGRLLLSLLSNILDITNIESGHLTLHPATQDLDAICRDAIERFQSEASAKQIKLMYRPIQVPERITADKQRVQQIIDILISNALKFTSPDGKVGVVVTQDESNEKVLVRVVDTGIGIAAEDIPKLFKPFVQLDSALSRQYEGTGLGLVIAERLARLHGGHISIVSQVGRGSQFTLALPRVAARPYAHDRALESGLAHMLRESNDETQQSNSSQAAAAALANPQYKL